MLKPVSALRRNVDGSLGSGRSQRRSVGGSVPRTHEERDRESAEDPYYSPITPRKLLSAPGRNRTSARGLGNRCSIH